MIQKYGSVSVSEDEVVVTGFQFVGTETRCDVEAIEWAHDRLQSALQSAQPHVNPDR